MINIEVTKNSNETTTSLIRRFTKRVQGAGVLPRVRSLRYHNRPETKAIVKKKKLKRLGKQVHYELLAKLGKLPVETKKKRGGFGR